MLVAGEFSSYVRSSGLCARFVSDENRTKLAGLTEDNSATLSWCERHHDDMAELSRDHQKERRY